MAELLTDQAWVSATATRNHLLRNPLIDWLNLHGSDHGFVPDTEFPDYDERLEFPPFIMQKGVEFEAAITEHLATLQPVLTIAKNREDVRDPDVVGSTLAAMREGCPVIHQGVLHEAESYTYGAPDFLIRSDVLAELFPDSLPTAESATGASELGNNPWHYVVVDAKFTTLHLLAGGQVGNSGSSPAYKAQLYIYNRALGRLQGYSPPTAFLLGRGWAQTIRGTTSRGTNAMERLGPAGMGDDIRVQVDSACDWLRRVRSEGAQWSPLSYPTVPELWPNATEDGFPWQGAVSQIATELNELTQLWWVGPDKRTAGHREGIYSWRDPQATAKALDVTGDTTGPTLQAILDINQTDTGPPVMPATIRTAEGEWRPVPKTEFYVDFETVNNVDDDFANIPEQNGQNLIFMIGCGHVENDEWVFRSFCVDRLSEASEAEIIDDWLAYMWEVGTHGNSRIIHWSYAEPVNYEEAYDSARMRHPEKDWPGVNWFDFWAGVVRKEPVVVRGALSFGLKAFARAMHSHGLIETSWGDTKVDGLGAMTGAWWCNTEAQEKGSRLMDVDLMHDIAGYNEVDCKVMHEIVSYLRQNH